MYEYVTKAEYQPIREEIEKIIKKTQVYMKKNFKTTFQFRLIGSGSRHLITRIKNGNSGYDFDYNLILQEPKDGRAYNASILKHQFMEAFKNALKGTKYSNPQDSTSAITIKVVDNKNSKIEHSCDFAVIYYDSDIIDNGYFYLRNNKNQSIYTFEFRKLSVNVESKLFEILQYRNAWNEIREEYLKIKNSNRDLNKHSFSLYLEAVNNIYNAFEQNNDTYYDDECYDEYDDEDDWD